MVLLDNINSRSANFNAIKISQTPNLQRYIIYGTVLSNSKRVIAIYMINPETTLVEKAYYFNSEVKTTVLTDSYYRKSAIVSVMLFRINLYLVYLIQKDLIKPF